MTRTFEAWRGRARVVLATLGVSAFALTICQQCLNSAMGQPEPDPDPNNCKIVEDPET